MARSRFSRRQFLARGVHATIGVAAAGALRPRAASAAGPTAIDIAQSYDGTTEILALHAAADRGYYQQNGLSVKIAQMGGGSALAEALAARAINYGIGASFSMAAAIQHGVPVKLVALALDPLLEVLIVRPDAGIAKIQDLKGKRIAITRQASLTDFETAFVVNKAGLAPGDVQIVPLGTVGAMRTALARKQIDGAMMFGVDVDQVEFDRVGTPLVRMHDLAPHAGNESFVARADFIQKEPNVIRALLRSHYQAVAYISRNPDYAAALFQKLYNVDRSIAAAYYADTIGLISYDGRFSLDGLDFMMKAAVSLKLIDRPLPVEQIITREFVPVAV